MNSEEKFAKIVSALKRRPNVSVGDGKKGFGASALNVNGKIFAMISSKGNYVVKLPKDRVAALVVDGQGKRFEPARGRVMKEWLAVDPGAKVDWLTLAREALQFVAGNSE